MQYTNSKNVLTMIFGYSIIGANGTAADNSQQFTAVNIPRSFTIEYTAVVQQIYRHLSIILLDIARAYQSEYATKWNV